MIKHIVWFFIVILMSSYGYYIGCKAGSKLEIDNVSKIWATCIFEGHSQQECGIGFIRRWLK